MIVELYIHEGGYLIVARNMYDEKEQYLSMPGDGIFEYVASRGRLNISYIVYCLEQIKNPTEEQKQFLAFLNRANDNPEDRRIREPGWEKHAGLSTGEVPRPLTKAGDVVVYGDVAQAILKVG